MALQSWLFTAFENTTCFEKLVKNEQKLEDPQSTILTFTIKSLCSTKPTTGAMT
jgi:hypothetical protein